MDSYAIVSLIGFAAVALLVARTFKEGRNVVRLAAPARSAPQPQRRRRRRRRRNA